MLRRDIDPLMSPDRISHDPFAATSPGEIDSSEVYERVPQLANLDIQRELNRMEEMLLDSPRIPLSRRTIVDEVQLLEQLDLVRLALPTAFQEAMDVIRQKEEILLDAERYAQEMVASAEHRAAQILNEMGLLRQAELEANQVRQRIQQECEVIREQTLTEIEQMRFQAQQDLEELRRMAIAEYEEIQHGADDYADRVLHDMEQQLLDMVRVIRNGRQQLSPNDDAAQGSPAANGAREADYRGSRQNHPGRISDPRSAQTSQRHRA